MHIRERDTSALGLLRETDLEDDANEVHLLVYGSNGVPYLKELVVIIHHRSLSLSKTLSLPLQNPLSFF